MPELQCELPISQIALRSKFQSTVYLNPDDNTETNLRNWRRARSLYVHFSLSRTFRLTALHSAELAFLKATFCFSLGKTTGDSVLRPLRTAKEGTLKKNLIHLRLLFLRVFYLTALLRPMGRG